MNDEANKRSTIAVLSELEKLILNLNHTAMDFLRKDDFKMATKLLQKAEINLMQVNN
jgi:hypothetical protein